jgi:hypothetical protein
VPEIEIIEIAENVCNLKKQEADWMLKIDIVEKGDKLELVEQDEEGHCNAECKTIERACQEVKINAYLIGVSLLLLNTITHMFHKSQDHILTY